MSIPQSVMVVDNEEELAHLFMKIVKRICINSVSFTDPLQYIKHHRTNSKRYSLVLRDLKTPGINKIDLKKIRKYNTLVDQRNHQIL